MKGIERAFLPLGTLIWVAVATAIVASCCGAFVSITLAALVAPGDGGLALALGAIGPFVFIGAIIGFVLGLPILTLTGIPIYWRYGHFLTKRRWIATGAASLVGGISAAVICLMIFGSEPGFLWAAIPIGVLYGLNWTIFMNRLANNA